MKLQNIDFKMLFSLMLLSILLWCIGILLAISPPFENIYPNITTGPISTSDSIAVNQVEALSGDLTTIIILNNLKSIFINFIGFFSLGIITIMNLIYNGFMHGFSIRFSISIAGCQAWYRILPHSFELVGLFISGAIGFYNTIFLLKLLFNRKVNIKNYITTTSLSLLLSCIIIILSGIVEGKISASL